MFSGPILGRAKGRSVPWSRGGGGLHIGGEVTRGLAHDMDLYPFLWPRQPMLAWEKGYLGAPTSQYCPFRGLFLPHFLIKQAHHWRGCMNPFPHLPTSAFGRPQAVCSCGQKTGPQPSHGPHLGAGASKGCPPPHPPGVPINGTPAHRRLWALTGSRTQSPLPTSARKRS